jgi:hypothetical protein
MGSGKRQPVPDGKFELVLESENVGAWMAINNAFAFEWGDKPATPERRNVLSQPDAYWNGVLIQLGRFKRISDGQLMSGFRSIDFLHGVNTVGSLGQQDFNGGIVWINIVYNQQGKPPVQPSEFRTSIKLGEFQTTMFERAKALHHFLQPFPGGITLWHEKGYTIDATIDGPAPRHVRHTFTLDVPNPDVLRIEVLRLMRGDAGPHWRYAKSLRRPEQDSVDWMISHEVDDLVVQEKKAQEQPMSGLLTRNQVDRIVIVKNPADGGQQIGKNPPQN